MLYSETHRAVFCRTPKCGNRSCARWFREECGGKPVPRVGTHSVNVPRRFVKAGYSVFTVVRNPFTRIIKYWSDQKPQRLTLRNWIDWAAIDARWRRVFCQSRLHAKLAKSASGFEWFRLEEPESVRLMRPFPAVEVGRLKKDRSWTNDHLGQFEGKTLDLVLGLCAYDFDHYGYSRNLKDAVLT